MLFETKAALSIACAVHAGLVGPKTTICGVSTAAAIWRAPLSMHSRNCALLSMYLISPKLALGGAIKFEWLSDCDNSVSDCCSFGAPNRIGSKLCLLQMPSIA